MATRLLLRSLRRHPLRTPASSSPPSPPNPHTLQRVQSHLHVLPRALQPSIWWFGGRSGYSSTAAPPGRRRILRNMLSASLVSTSAAAVDLEGNMKSTPTSPHSVSGSHGATLLLHWDNGVENTPPTRPHVEREKRPMTDALIALHLLVHAIDKVTNGKLIMWGHKLNMLALDGFGSVMEEVTGPGRLLAIYCTSAVAAQAMSYSFTPGNSVGASGPICGLIGAQGVYTWRRRESLTSSRDTLKNIRDLVLLNLAFALALRLIKIRVDNWAHLGGILGGAAFELFLGPHGKQHVARIGPMALEDKTSVLLA